MPVIIFVIGFSVALGLFVAWAWLARGTVLAQNRRRLWTLAAGLGFLVALVLGVILDAAF